jgi:hypothetical protein
MPSHRIHKERCHAWAPVRVGPDEPHQCCICFDACCTSTRDKDAEFPLQLPCGHVFHDACITRWMQTKRTCPLCRFEFFDVDFDNNDDEYELWIDEETDSATPSSGISSGYTSTFSLVPDFPGERITIRELGFSAARSSTAAHRSFDAHSGGSLSAPPQHDRQPYHLDAQTGRRYGHGKTTTSYCEREDVWITTLVDQRSELAATGVGEGWVVALGEDEDEDETDKRELYRQLYPCDVSMQQVWLEDLVPDCLFDELLAGHMQWMHELDIAQYDAYDTYDEFDYLV